MNDDLLQSEHFLLSLVTTMFAGNGFVSDNNLVLKIIKGKRITIDIINDDT